MVARFLKQPMPVYDFIVKAFTLNDKAGLAAAIEAGVELLNQDQNLGLAQRCLEALTRHQLKRLSATFISLSLSDVARRAELPLPRRPSIISCRCAARGRSACASTPPRGS